MLPNVPLMLRAGRATGEKVQVTGGLVYAYGFFWP